MTASHNVTTNEEEINQQIEGLLALSPLYPKLQDKLQQLLQQTTTLDLSKNEEQAAIKDAIHALQGNTSITILDFGYCAMGTKRAKELAQIILNNTTITILYLRGNNIGEAGVKHITQAMKVNKTITTLSLSGSNIGDAGAEHIAKAIIHNKTITALDLKLNNIGEAGAKHIAEAMIENKNITTLNLELNNIGEAGAKHIAEAMIENKNITTLDLWGNHIGEAGAKYIAQAMIENKNITTLSLGKNNIEDAGAKYIAQAMIENKNITKLDLWENNIGDAGAKYIAQAMIENKNITTLYLRWNNIGDAGAEHIVKAMKTNKTITELNLNNNDIEEAALLTRLNTYLKRNQKIAANSPSIPHSPKKQDITTQLGILEQKIAAQDDRLFHAAAGKELHPPLTQRERTTLSHPKCTHYYFHMNKHIHNLLLTYHLLGSENGEEIPAVEVLSGIANSSLPGMNAVTHSIAIGLHTLDTEMQKKAQQKISNLFSAIDPTALSPRIARLMTLRYAEQIKQCGNRSKKNQPLDNNTENAIKTFAHYGAARMLTYISLPEQHKTTRLVEQCVTAISNTTSAPLTELDSLALTLMLSTRYVRISKEVKAPPLKRGKTEANLHTATGLYTQTGKYFTAPNNTTIQAEKYGYALATEAEARTTKLSEEKNLTSRNTPNPSPLILSTRHTPISKEVKAPPLKQNQTKTGKSFTTPNNTTIKAEKYRHTLTTETETHITKLSKEKSLPSSTVGKTIQNDVQNILQHQQNQHSPTGDAIFNYLSSLDKRITNQEKSSALEKENARLKQLLAEKDKEIERLHRILQEKEYPHQINTAMNKLTHNTTTHPSPNEPHYLGQHVLHYLNEKDRKSPEITIPQK